MIAIKTYYQEIYDKLKDTVDMVYLQERPTAVNKKVNAYLVIGFVSNFSNREIDQKGSYDYFVTTVSIGLFVRDKVSANNPNAMDISAISEKATQILSKFPLVGEHVKVTKPRLTIGVSDGSGFHRALIQARVTTLF